jgi:hypothetical protein
MIQCHAAYSRIASRCALGVASYIQMIIMNDRRANRLSRRMWKNRFWCRTTQSARSFAPCSGGRGASQRCLQTTVFALGSGGEKFRNGLSGSPDCFELCLTASAPQNKSPSFCLALAQQERSLSGNERAEKKDKSNVSPTGNLSIDERMRCSGTSFSSR